MARYTGPSCRLCRREGVKLFLKGERCFGPKCAIERRNLPPGQPGTGRPPRQRFSNYAQQLREKQKLRRTYGVMERQFRRYFEMAERQSGRTGEIVLQMLELRLDNVFFRMGFATSRKQARQLVSHGHVEVNGRRAKSPSQILAVGDLVGVRASSRNLSVVQTALEINAQRPVQSWVEVNPGEMSGRVTGLPGPQSSDVAIQEQLIVEYYSR